MDAFSFDKLRNLLPTFPSSTSEEEGFQDTADMTSPDDFDDDNASVPIEDDTTSVIDPRPITPDNGVPPPKSNLDLINDCDTFPYFHTDSTLYFSHINTYFHLRVAAHPNTTLGYVLPSVAEVLRGLSAWELNDDERTLTLIAGENEEERSMIVAATTRAMRETGHFAVLKGWRNELYPVYGPNKELLFSIERSASPLFGVVSYGVHCTAYTYVDEEDETPSQETSTQEEKRKTLKLWIPRRAATKQTYGGLLDNTVAGGLATGETPLPCLIREADEEASLPSSLVSSLAKPAGCITYFSIRDKRAGGETGLLQPECQYIYDLPLPADVVPQPKDGEVEEFYLWGIDEVRDRLRKGEFKPNCAVVLLDWFVRHGVLAQEDEGDLVEIVARLHRRLEFPTV